MGETIWLGELVIWAVLALLVFGLSVWYFVSEAEFEDFIGLLQRWLALLAAVAGLFAATFFGLMPSDVMPPILGLSLAGLVGGLLGIVLGLLRSR